MTTDTDLNPNGYAVVHYLTPESDPSICRGMVHGKEIDGKIYAIYDTAEEAVTEFDRWPTRSQRYGIVPLSTLIEERTVVERTLRESAIA